MLNTIIRRRRAPLAVGLLAGACLTLVGGTAAMAAPPPGSYSVPLHQPTPITAAGFGSQEKVCDSIPSTEDGWHFVLPNHFTHFVTLTVTFSPGGTQTITSFGPPNDQHAFAASAPGAELTSASAVVVTDSGKKKVDWFNLSHTCPATVTSSPSPSMSVSPSPSMSVSPSPSMSVSPSPSQSMSPSASPSPSHTHKPHHHKPHHKPHHKRHHHRHHRHHRPPAPPAPVPTPVRHEFPVTG